MTIRDRKCALRGGHIAALLLAVVMPFLSGCAGAPQATQGRAAIARPEALLSEFGVRVDGLHLSAHGYLLDLRYRVVDPDKAAPLLDAKRKVYLVDDVRSAKLGVPESPIIGGMRQTSRNRVVYTDRDYFILFVNPGKSVQTGDRLTLAVGERKMGSLAVQ